MLKTRKIKKKRLKRKSSVDNFKKNQNKTVKKGIGILLATLAPKTNKRLKLEDGFVFDRLTVFETEGL
ncbi:MAG: hypothetical protein HAW67_06315 [Endozoicomonadaceae bacterium]|nr:hypothetical protein [Endozoicomonadaceae bacterium]